MVGEKGFVGVEGNIDNLVSPFDEEVIRLGGKMKQQGDNNNRQGDLIEEFLGIVFGEPVREVHTIDYKVR